MDLYARLKQIKEQKAAEASPSQSAPKPKSVPKPPTVSQPQPSGKSQPEKSPPPAGTAAARISAAEPSTTRPSSTGGNSDGWQHLDGTVWKRVLRYPLSAPDASPHAALGSYSDDWGNYRYIDTETTGLSGGAGSWVFLIGSGRFLEGEFELTQWFMGDFPDEPLMLSDLSSQWDGNACFVSYNGKSFDMPLLRTRHLMCGMFRTFDRHLDLLYPGRRLYGESLERCRLSDIEASVLGVRRDLDIPGSLIPDRYFDFQKAGAGRRPDEDVSMLPVLEHHAQDIVSLARFHLLLSADFGVLVAALAGTPAVRLPEFWSPYGTARQLIGAGMEELALQVLEGATDKKSLELRGFLLRRRGYWREAAEAFSTAWRDWASARSLISWLILLEHRLDMAGRVVEIVSELDMEQFAENIRTDLEKRLARCEKRLRDV